MNIEELVHKEALRRAFDEAIDAIANRYFDGEITAGEAVALADEVENDPQTETDAIRHYPDVIFEVALATASRHAPPPRDIHRVYPD